MKDYYEKLEILPDASEDEIKTQYRFLLHAWHPDKFPNPEQKAKAQERTKELNEAYSTLSKPDKRTQYDRERSIRSDSAKKSEEQAKQKQHAEEAEAKRQAENEHQQREHVESEKRRGEYERQQKEKAEKQRQYRQPQKEHIINDTNTTQKIVVAGIMSAVSIVLSIPIGVGPLTSLGFITLGPAIAFTFMHVPAIIGGVMEGPVVGLIVGAAFGLFSLFLAGQQPAGSPNAIFVDPIISVVPRLFIGPVAWFIYRAIRGASENAGLIGAAIGGTLTNTLLVIGAIALRLGVPFFPTLASVGLNVVIELIVASVLVVAIVGALRGATGGRGGSSV